MAQHRVPMRTEPFFSKSLKSNRLVYRRCMAHARDMEFPMKTAADPAPAIPVLRWAASVALLATLCGCAAPRQEILVPGERVAAPAMPAPAPQAATQATSTAGQTTSFSTQLATYTEIGFDDLPGWSTDNFAESWPAFLDSCKVLSTRGTSWTALCAKARQVNGSSNAAIRSE